MASRQMINFIEAKLVAHGVEKLVPDDAVIEEHARRLLEQRFAGAAIAPLRTVIAQRARTAVLPADLTRRIAAALADNPALPWDVALAQVLGEETP
jgi:hypothetical protein